MIASGQSHVNCSFLDLTFDKTVTVTESFYKPLSLREAVKKKQQDIFWHRVNFICHLPTLPNYDKIWHKTKLSSSFTHSTFFPSSPPLSSHDCLVGLKHRTVWLKRWAVLKTHCIVQPTQHALQLSLHSFSTFWKLFFGFSFFIFWSLPLVSLSVSQTLSFSKSDFVSKSLRLSQSISQSFRLNQ